MMYLHPKKQKFQLRPHHHVLMIGGLLAMLLGGYILFQGRDVFFGPRLSLIEPRNGALIEGRVLVRGKTDPLTKVFINELESVSDKNGNFEEAIPFAKGFHVVEVVTKNRFNKEARVVRQIVVK
ncbi:MAG: hypothetical protein HY006_03245 [Candidatus Sungbacteria bacterium]|nr:hypothetical protein [Candidatus Sungbacteria bacterium]